jgi:hypothetical protein
MAQKPMLQAEVYARALRASKYVKGAKVWVDISLTFIFIIMFYSFTFKRPRHAIQRFRPIA